jgi:c-di-GMP-binding flagellar brake protein YcgR
MFTMFRIARNYGLDRSERKLLTYVFRVSGVEKPEEVLQKEYTLDRCFKQAYRAITRTAKNKSEANDRLAELFALRNFLDIVPAGAISSTRQIEEDTPVMISMERKNFHSKVVTVHADGISLSCPENNLGTTIRIAQGTKIRVTFLVGINFGLSFEAKSPQIRQSSFGPVLPFPHTNNLKKLTQRRYRRKEFSLPCYFYKVITEQVESGRKQKTKMTVDKQRIKASIEDISAGGCSLKTPVMIADGTRLKIVVHYSDDPIICLGQVLRVSKEGINIILHIKFIKVPQKSSNAINALVFDFE